MGEVIFIREKLTKKLMFIKVAIYRHVHLMGIIQALRSNISHIYYTLTRVGSRRLERGIEKGA